jgi:hypothetical protein
LLSSVLRPVNGLLHAVDYSAALNSQFIDYFLHTDLGILSMPGTGLTEAEAAMIFKIWSDEEARNEFPMKLWELRMDEQLVNIGSDLWVWHLVDLTQPRVLSMQRFSFESLSPEWLAYIDNDIFKFPWVTTLNLSGSSVVESEVRAMIKCCPGVKVIIVDGCPNLTERCLTTMITARDLRLISVCGMKLTHDHFIDAIDDWHRQVLADGENTSPRETHLRCCLGIHAGPCHAPFWPTHSKGFCWRRDFNDSWRRKQGATFDACIEGVGYECIDCYTWNDGRPPLEQMQGDEVRRRHSPLCKRCGKIRSSKDKLDEKKYEWDSN